MPACIGIQVWKYMAHAWSLTDKMSMQTESNNLLRESAASEPVVGLVLG